MLRIAAKYVNGFLLLSLLLLIAVPSLAEARPAQDLTGAWKVIPAGRMDDTNDSAWPIVQLPGNLAPALKETGNVIWLRKELNVEPGRYNLSFLSGPIYDRLDVYVNGIRIGGGPESPGRPLVVAIPGSILKPGLNYIALRIQSTRKISAGILRGPLMVQNTEAAREIFWKSEITNFVFSLLFLSSSIFFILLHFRVEAGRIYLPSGLGYGVMALLFLCENEIMHWVVGLTGVLEITATVAGVLFPALFYPFVIRFFGMETPPHYRTYWWVVIGVAFSTALLYALRLHGVVELVELSWKFLNIPVFFFAAYIAFKELSRKQSAGGFIIAAAFLVFLIHGLISLFNKQFWLPGAIQLGFFSVVGLLLPATIIVLQLIGLQRDVDLGRLKMESVNELRTRIFHHIHLAISQPVLEITTQVRKKMQDGFSRKEATGVQFHLTELEKSLDDVLELSRLEVMEEPEARVPVNVGDFLSAVLPTSGVTCTVKVHPRLELESSLELVHSAVIRLVDFPGFKTFRHIDLIVTSDLEENLHFRFLLQHDDRKTMRRMQRILTGKLPDLEGLWIQWGIIQEIIRILDGSLDVRILNRKFLCIDVRLDAHLPAEDALEREDSGLRVVSLVEQDKEAEALAKAAAASQERIPEVRFHANMTTTELVTWIKQKFKKSA
ncbi:MAG: hypothetical protein CMN76_17625 [Spirochaetaceae bacterium]|nr:hypothetical protein [Spirochaetaceae bacterium]|tara:strand:- start:30835 stop:32829 length:1995 start_codon:yes stop_codon:yes gene_type:complete